MYIRTPPSSLLNTYMSSPTPEGMGLVVDNFLLDHIGLHHVLDGRRTWDTSPTAKTQELFGAYMSKSIYSHLGPLKGWGWGGAPFVYSVSPSPNWALEFGTALSFGLS